MKSFKILVLTTALFVVGMLLSDRVEAVPGSDECGPVYAGPVYNVYCHQKKFTQECVLPPDGTRLVCGQVFNDGFGGYCCLSY